MNIRICITATEVVNGFIQDSNSHFFSHALYGLGYKVVEVRVIRDQTEQIEKVWKELQATGDLVIHSGGLGPTADDLTVDMMCQLLNCQSQEDQVALQKLKNYFANKKNYSVIKKESFELARRQIRYPELAEVIANPMGIAPGFFVRSFPFIALPGFPVEIKSMWSAVIKILESLPLTKLQTTERTLWGMGESDLYSKITFPSDIETGVHAKPFGNKLFFRRHDSQEQHKEKPWQDVLQQLEQQFPFAIGDNPLQELIHFFKKNKFTLTMAESCTAGWAAKLLTDYPGVSSMFHGSVVSYANEVKQKIIHVNKRTLKKHGAVSKQCAFEMATGVRKLMKADVGFSITGIAGPSGGSLEKPVGTVFIGFSFSKRIARQFSLPFQLSGRFYFPYGRERFRLVAAHAAYITLWQIFCKAQDFNSWKQTDLYKNFVQK